MIILVRFPYFKTKRIFTTAIAKLTMSATSEISDISMEVLVGISTFANTASGFQGIHKQRYSDFVVREVSQGGQVCSLLNLDASKLESELFVSKDARKEATDPEIIELSITELEAITVPEAASFWVASREDLKQFLIACLNKTTGCPSHFPAFPCSDKILRTRVHEHIKTQLGDLVDSDTLSVENVQHIRLIAKHLSKGHFNKRSRPQWPQGIGNYLRFTLLKENIDTMSACSLLCKNLNLKPGGIDYAGTKDKRAITSQKCTVYRRRPSELVRVNRFCYHPLLRVGDFEYVNEPIGLGDLGGNCFSIALRSLNAPTEVVAAACLALKSSGFINYFGLQRFGKGGTGSHAIGKAIMKGEWKQAVELMFTDREGDRPEVAQVKQAFMMQQYKQARKIIPYQMYAEKCVLEALAQHPNDFLGAFNRVPKNTRLIVIHAYQSYIWNKAASERIRLYGLQCAVGDLVAVTPGAVLECEDDELLAAEDSDQTLTQDSGAKAAASAVAAPDVAVTDDVFQRSSKLDYDGIRSLTAEDVAAGTFTIRDVILPIPGSIVMMPQNAVGEYYAQLLAEDGLSPASFSTCAPQYRTRGAYRRLLQFPREFEWAVVSYSDPHCELVETELTSLRADDPKPRGKEGRPAAAGAATAGAATADEQGAAEAVSEPSPALVQPLVSSLPMKPMVISTSGVEHASIALASEGCGDIKGSLLPQQENADHSGVACSMEEQTGTDLSFSSSPLSPTSSSAPALLRAVVLKFILPPGTYATMLLRELTKASTETMYQANLSAVSFALAASTSAAAAAAGGLSTEPIKAAAEELKQQRDLDTPSQASAQVRADDDVSEDKLMSEQSSKRSKHGDEG